MVWSHGACLSKELYSTGSTGTVDRQWVSNYAWDYVKWAYIDSARVTYNVNGHAMVVYVCIHMHVYMQYLYVVCGLSTVHMSAYSTSDCDIC